MSSRSREMAMARITHPGTSARLTMRGTRRRALTTPGLALVSSLFVATLPACEDATEPPQPTTVTVRPASATLAALGDSVQFTAEVRDQHGEVMANAGVSWSSSDVSATTVNTSGLVTAAGNGMATITATSGSASGTATATVEQVARVLVVTPTETELSPDDTVRLTAEAGRRERVRHRGCRLRVVVQRHGRGGGGGHRPGPGRMGRVGDDQGCGGLGDRDRDHHSWPRKSPRSP